MVALRSVVLPAASPSAAAAGGQARSTRTRRQHAAHFLRMLENRGSWDGSAAGGGGASSSAPLSFALPEPQVWDALCQHAPELAEVACEAADVASSTRYFEVGGLDNPLAWLLA